MRYDTWNIKFRRIAKESKSLRTCKPGGFIHFFPCGCTHALTRAVIGK